MIVPFQAQPTPLAAQFIIGATYEHDTFGLGILLSAEDTDNDIRLVIKFANVGVKIFLSQLCQTPSCPLYTVLMNGSA